jgi:hypothetical protein
MKRLGLSCLVLVLGGCLSAWPVGGPWACSSDGTCASGVCDDGVCCDRDGPLPCPTMTRTDGTCPDARTPGLLYEDADGDGWGNENVSRLFCGVPQHGHWAAQKGDCDDANPAVNPAAKELCNGLDDNCDGQLDENLVPRTAWYRDQDGDGAGDPSTQVFACVAPVGFVASSDDCKPFDAARHPGAPELCNGVDDDCDSQVDEAPLADVQNASDSTVKFPCGTGQPGVCADGAFQCVAGQRQCVARRSPGLEVCNQLDDDCDGLVDEQPECGGPPALTGALVHVGAFKLNDTTGLNKRCQKGMAGSTPETATGSTWSSTSSGFNVWYAEPADGGVWDLSGPDTRLNLHLRATFTPDGQGNAWSVPASGGSRNPVVYLCGDADTDIMRYVISPGAAFQGAQSSFDSALQLNVSDTNTPWILGLGSGFDTSRVRRVELVVQVLASDFTVTFTPDAGFSR